MRGRSCSLAWMRKMRDFLTDPSMTQEEKAEFLCFSQPEVSYLIKAIETKEKLQEKIGKYNLSYISEEELEWNLVSPTHYREIAKAPENEQVDLATRVSKDGLSVNQTRALIKKIKGEDLLFEYPEEVFEYNVWEAEKKRDPRYGDTNFHGNCSGQVVKQCLWRYLYPYVEDVKSALVIDPMAGSGTTRDVCLELDIPIRAFDIYPEYKGIERGDARKLNLQNEIADLIFIHFPYWNMVRYNEVFKTESNLADISLMNYKDFLDSSEQIFEEMYRLLKPDRFLTILIGDMRKSREIIDLSADFSFLGRSNGFKLFDKVIKIVAAQRSRTPLSKWRAQKYNFHQLTCDTLLVFRKEGS
ncbi:MAG: hypothetical protein ACFFDT_38665 [Candidatus Hodarchaeota archaeon]